jgi:hypothetical protein
MDTASISLYHKFIYDLPTPDQFQPFITIIIQRPKKNKKIVNFMFSSYGHIILVSNVVRKAMAAFPLESIGQNSAAVYAAAVSTGKIQTGLVK